jgi:hypothetical protein
MARFILLCGFRDTHLIAWSVVDFRDVMEAV